MYRSKSLAHLTKIFLLLLTPMLLLASCGIGPRYEYTPASGEAFATLQAIDIKGERGGISRLFTDSEITKVALKIFSVDGVRVPFERRKMVYLRPGMRKIKIAGITDIEFEAKPNMRYFIAGEGESKDFKLWLIDQNKQVIKSLSVKISHGNY